MPPLDVIRHSVGAPAVIMCATLGNMTKGIKFNAMVRLWVEKEFLILFQVDLDFSHCPALLSPLYKLNLTQFECSQRYTFRCDFFVCVQFSDKGEKCPKSSTENVTEKFVFLWQLLVCFFSESLHTDVSLCACDAG